MKSYVPFLSLRYLWFHKVSSGLGILGVTLGVGLVIVVVGVMDGFQTRLKTTLVGNTAPVVVYPHYEVDAEALVEALKSKVPGVLGASPVVEQPTVIAQEDNRRSAPCQVVGIDPSREAEVTDLARKMPRLLESASREQPFRTPDEVRAADRRLRPEKQGVVVGSRLLWDLGIRVGDRVQIYSARKNPGASGAPKGRDVSFEQELFTVTGVFSSDYADLDKVLVLMDRRDALSYFRDWIRVEAQEVRLRLGDEERCDEVKREIEGRAEEIVRASLKKGGRMGAIPLELEVKTWKEIHSKILAAVENERELLLVITSFSFIVVAFLIGSTQSMLVVEKTREIGVLRSLGASVGGTSSVFLANGFFIGTLGALAGWGVGVWVTSSIQEIADFIRRVSGRDLFPPDIYQFSKIPIDVQSDFVLAICLGAVGFALLGAILPAVRAALLDPVESLHHE